MGLVARRGCCGGCVQVTYYGALHARHVGRGSEPRSPLAAPERGQGQDSHSRLQEILAALQATPNGVVLLDSEGHIGGATRLLPASLASTPSAM